jgi:acyl-CoA dehydrogenase
MDFSYSVKVEAWRSRVLEFMTEQIYPAEPIYDEQRRTGIAWSTPPIMAQLKAEAERRGLWNMFLPNKERGAGLTNLEYAPLCELLGRSPWIAPEATNCSAPDTGNMEILLHYGTESVKAQMAHTASPRRDQVGLFDDGARRGQLGRKQHSDANRKGWRSFPHQWAEVVV